MNVSQRLHFFPLLPRAKRIFKNSTLRQTHALGARPRLDTALRIAVIHQLCRGNGLSKGPILQPKHLHGAGAQPSARPLHHNPCQVLAPRRRGDEPDDWPRPLFTLEGVAEEGGRVFPLIRSHCCTGRRDGRVTANLLVSMLVLLSGPINFYCAAWSSHFVQKSLSPATRVHCPAGELPRRDNCPSCVLLFAPLLCKNPQIWKSARRDGNGTDRN